MDKQKLFIVFNRAMTKLKHSDVDKKEMLIQRLSRAFGILQSPSAMFEDMKRYEPTKHSCGCEDYIYRMRHIKHGFCKHMAFVVLSDRMSAIQYRQLDFFSIIQ